MSRNINIITDDTSHTETMLMTECTCVSEPLPPGYMQVVDRGTESLTLAGLLPAAASVSNDITVEVTPSPSYLPQHTVSGTNYSVTALGLKPGTSYTITVATVSGREHSNSTEQTFYTRKLYRCIILPSQAL